jgi:hypothetical protein
MPVHEALGNLLERSTKPQKIVAVEWVEAWNAAHADDQVSQSSIPSRLSELLKGKTKGIKFFFEVRERAALLFGVLGATDEERTAIDAEAQTFLKDGGKLPIRLVIDVAGLTENPQDSTALFASLDKTFLRFPEWQRVILLLTRDQHMAFPRPFDEDYVEKGALTVERVEESAAEGRALSLSEGGALVVTHRWRHDIATWIAIGRRRNGGFAFHPDPDVARASVARDGRLAVATPLHPLEAAGVAAEPCRFPDDALWKRQMMDILVDERQAELTKLPPGNRRWLGEQIGVVACSLPLERALWAATRLADHLKSEVERATPAHVQAVLDRALRRPVADRVLLVDNEVHVVNPSRKLAFEEHEQVRVHKVERTQSALSRILDATKAWTVEDYVKDPLLTDLTKRLIANGAAEGEVEHARTGLLFAGALHGLPEAAEEHWQAGLQKLLDAEPPATVFELDAPSAEERHLSALVIAKVGRDSEKPARPLPAAANVVIDRETSFQSFSWKFQQDGYVPEGSPLLPPTETQALDESWMLDAFEASSLISSRGRPAGAPRGCVTVHCEAREKTMVKLLQSIWRWADETLGQMWLLLREAVATTQPVRLADGRHMLPLGSGWVATLRARRNAGNEACSAAFHAALPLKTSYGYNDRSDVREETDDLVLLAPCSVPRDGLLAWQLVRDDIPPLVREDLSRYGRSDAPVPFDVPRRLTLRGAGLVVDIAFSYSPFAPSSSPRSPLSVTRSAESAEARAIDDDDDDE